MLLGIGKTIGAVDRLYDAKRLSAAAERGGRSKMLAAFTGGRPRGQGFIDSP